MSSSKCPFSPRLMSATISLPVSHESVVLTTGTIPTTIAEAIYVEELDFSSNSFTGILPAETYKLDNLIKLSVAFNEMTGPILDVSEMDDLKWFNVSNNQFSDIIPDFSLALKLEKVDLSGNAGLSGVVELGPKLSTVVVHDTKITVNNPLGLSLNTGESEGLGTGMIAGIVCFAVLAVAVGLGVVRYLFKKRSHERKMNSRMSSDGDSYLASVSSKGSDNMSHASGASGASGVSSVAGLKRVGKWQFIRGKGNEGGKKKLTFYMEIDSDACIWSGRYDGREVAIKKLKTPESKLGKLQLAQRYIAEAENMQLMKHERIVEFIDFEMDFFVMISEMMPLGSLYTRIKNRRFNWPDRYQVMLDICEGMTHLHSKKNADGTSKKEFMHQNLSSKCVRLCVEDGKLRAKVAEFGLINMREEDNFLVDKERRYYQAPELYDGSKTEYTKKCDMFSAGVVFLEITLMRLPDDLYLEVWPQILKHDLPSKFPDKFLFLDSLQRALKSCLDDKPANRTGFAELFELLSENPGEICRLDESKSAFESFCVETPDASAMNFSRGGASGGAISNMQTDATDVSGMSGVSNGTDIN